MLVERKMEEKFRELGLGELDLSAPPIDFNSKTFDAHCLSFVQVDHAAYITAVPSINGRSHYTGRLGENLSVEEGYKAAQMAAFSALIELKHAIGDLDRVKRIALMLAFITSKEGFTDQPRVANGASDLFESIFGERHARASLGVVGMAGGNSIEIVVMFELK